MQNWKKRCLSFFEKWRKSWIFCRVSSGRNWVDISFKILFSYPALVSISVCSNQTKIPPCTNFWKKIQIFNVFRKKQSLHFYRTYSSKLKLSGYDALLLPSKPAKNQVRQKIFTPFRKFWKYGAAFNFWRLVTSSEETLSSIGCENCLISLIELNLHRKASHVSEKTKIWMVAPLSLLPQIYRENLVSLLSHLVRHDSNWLPGCCLQISG